MQASTSDAAHYLVVESDICTSQCKSAEHFFDSKCIADQINKPLNKGIWYYCKAANNGWWPVMTSDLFSQPFVFMFTCKYILGSLQIKVIYFNI